MKYVYFFVPVFKRANWNMEGMQTMSDDLYACWDQNGYPEWSTLSCTDCSRSAHIPFVSEIIRGSAENRCILVRGVVPWICHGASPSWGNGRFYGLWGVWSWDPYLWGMSRGAEGTQGQTTWFSRVPFTVTPIWGGCSYKNQLHQAWFRHCIALLTVRPSFELLKDYQF